MRSVDEVVEGLAREDGEHLVRFCFQLTHNLADAQDLVQESLIAVLQAARRRGSPPEHLYAYTRTAIIRRHIKGAEQASVRSKVEGSLRVNREHGPVTVIEERDAMWRALGALPPKQRAVLVLRHYEDLPDDRIAQLLGCRRATVRTLAARAAAALRKDLIDPSERIETMR